MDCKKRDSSEKSPLMLTVDQLCFSYGAHEILRDITFEAGEGQLCALFGPNGSGKTTLFKCCLNFLQPKSGAIYFGGKPIREMNVSAMACLLYTSDAADERSSVDLGGRRIIKKKNATICRYRCQQSYTKPYDDTNKTRR